MSERAALLSPDPGSEPGGIRHRACSNEAEAEEERGADEDDEPSLSPIRGAMVAVSLLLQLFIFLFGVSTLTTIQSSIATDLHVTDEASWFVSAYLIAATSVTPIAGKICLVFSTRSYLLVSTIIQTVGLLLTATASSFQVFIVARVVCGVGAAASTPVAFLLVPELVPPKHQGFVFGLIATAYTAGIALGAVVGGILEPLIGWRDTFSVQAPVCMAAGIAAFFAIPTKSHMKGSRQDDELSWWQRLARIDYLGVITLIAAVVLALYTLASPVVYITPLAVSVVLLILFYQIESRWAVDPVIPADVLCSRAMLLTGIATIGFMCARWELVLYVPTYGMAVRNWTQAKAGLLLLPTNVGLGVGSLVSGLFHIRRNRSYWLACIVCVAVFILNHLAIAWTMTADSSAWLFATLLFTSGCMAGAFLNYNLIHLLYLTPSTHHPIIMSVNATFRSLSGSIASSLTGGLFVRLLRGSLTDNFEARGLRGKEELIAQLLSRPMLVQSLKGTDYEVAQTSYVSTLQGMFVIGSAWVTVMMLLQAGTGWTPPQATSSDSNKDEDPRQDEVEGNYGAVSR